MTLWPAASKRSSTRRPMPFAPPVSKKHFRSITPSADELDRGMHDCSLL